MLHTKSQGHRPSGSGEEDFLKFFLPFMGMEAILVPHMKFEFNWSSGFRGGDF